MNNETHLQVQSFPKKIDFLSLFLKRTIKKPEESGFYEEIWVSL